MSFLYSILTFPSLISITRKHYKKGGNINTNKKGTYKKNMNCHPRILKKYRKKSDIKTCFTNEALLQIRDAYNKKHPTASKEELIASENPTEIWKSLQNKMQCNTDDCFLKELQNNIVRQELENRYFSPKQPNKWKTNPNEWLSNYDLENVMKQYEEAYPEYKFIGPTFIDYNKRIHGKCVSEELCAFELTKFMNLGKKKIGVIFNLDRHDQDGSHWVSLYIDIDAKFVFYFDSVGTRIPANIKRLADEIMKQGGKEMCFYQNHPKAHQRGGTECGVYSLFFLVTMLTNRRGGDIDEPEFNNAIEKIQFFKKATLTDQYIEKFRGIYFN